MKSDSALRRVIRCVTALAALSWITGCASVQMNRGPSVPTGPIRPRAPTVSVRLSKPPSVDAQIADWYANKVRGHLVEGRLRISSEKPDYLVELHPQFEEFDKAENFYRFKAQSDVAVVRQLDERLIGRQTVTADGPRTLGRSAAMQATALTLAQKSADFVLTTLSEQPSVPPEARGTLAVAEIVVKRPWWTRDHPAYTRLFVEKVRQLPGVTECRYLEDSIPPRLRFAVTYQPDLFPEGLLNRIILIPELRLPRRIKPSEQ